MARERQYKDTTDLWENDSAYEQRKTTTYNLRDYSLKHKVVAERELNDEADRDQIFKLKIDDVEVLLDAEQVSRMVRWV